MADLQVGLAVLELTAGHGKLVDNVVRAEIARRAGVSERTVTRALAKFVDADLVEWKPARARGQLGTLMLSRARDIPDALAGALTRDEYLSRVQPDPGQNSTEPGTGETRARDNQDVPLPPSDLHEPPRDAQKKELFDKVIELIVRKRLEHHANKPPAYREKTRRNVLDEYGGRLDGLIEKHELTTPATMLAGHLLGEPTPYLRDHRRSNEVGS